MIAASPLVGSAVGIDIPSPTAACKTPAADEPGSPHRQIALVLAAYLAFAVGLLHKLWRSPPTGRLTVGGVDQNLFEWYLWHGPHAVIKGENPLFTTLWNPPEGANLMANTSVLGLGLPLSPVTWLFGPQVTLVLALTLGLAGSAAAWFWLFRRLVPGSVLGAAVGGAFCAFGPPMISHANGAHLNLIVTCAIPFIIANALALREPRTGLRNGVPLGLLVVYQAFVGEEMLLLTALGLGLFCLVYAAMRPSAALAALPQMAKGLAVAAALALIVLAYPLWWQFFGPQNYSGLPDASKTTNDILAIVTLPSQSVFGDQSITKAYVKYHNEENAFFGLPLLILVAVAVWQLRRHLLVRIAALMIAISFVLSFGSTIRFGGHDLVPGPWRLFEKLPILDSLIVSRLAFLAVPFLGLMITMVIAAANRHAAERSPQALRISRYTLLAVAVALLPIIPTPLPVTGRPSTPTFFTTEAWRQVIVPGSTVMTVPMTMSNGGLDTITWQIPTDGQFSLVGGYFVGPHGSDRTGHYFPENTATQRLLNDLWRTGKAPKITDAHRNQARADFTKIRVDVIIVTARGHSQEVRDVLTQLLGSTPRQTSDVWVWKIRDGMSIG